MRRLLVLAVALVLFGAACQEEIKSPDVSVLEEGDEAPDFTLASPESEVSLADYRGERPVLLYFSMGPG